MSKSNYVSFFSFSSLADNAVGVAASVVLHVVLILAVIAGWQPSDKNLEVSRPKFIEAKLLQMKPAVAEPVKPKPAAKPKPTPKVDQAKKRAEEQRAKEKKVKAEAEKRKQEALRKKQKEEQTRKELERQEQLKREAELKRQQDLIRQQELADALAMEEEMFESEVNAQVGTYVDYMATLIASNWSRPPSARRDMQVLLQISLGSAGRVVGVQVAKSSGNSAFDLSAEQAVWRVGQFSRLREMDPGLYQREFRKINILFTPDDLRM